MDWLGFFESLIAAGVAITVCLINNSATLRKQQNLFEQQLIRIQAQMEQSIAITNVQIENLAKETQKHNSVIERTYKLEQNTALQEEKILSLNRRVGDIERSLQ